MRVVAALGGNALLRRGERADVDVQRRNIAVAVRALAEIAAEHELVITHGNGPQIGLLALQAEAYQAVHPYPLDVLGAESEGMIGYLLEQGLGNQLPGRSVATLLTQVIVDPDDIAFHNPSKPVGPVYSGEDAERIARHRSWTVAPDGDAWRRVVASPRPMRIVELEAIRTLVDAGILVICVGGGGVPVSTDEDGSLRGVEAVIDKDLAAALLARELDADALLLLTDVSAIETGWGTDKARAIAKTTPAQLAELALLAGSMGPKAAAAAWFVTQTGGVAGIGALADASAILAGCAGTTVLPVARSLGSSSSPQADCAASRLASGNRTPSLK
jgi:carbamate kinase